MIRAMLDTITLAKRNCDLLARFVVDFDFSLKAFQKLVVRIKYTETFHV